VGQKSQVLGPHPVDYPRMLARRPFELKGPYRQDGLFRLQEWVANHDALNLTLEEAARIACLERHYFSNKFTERVGQSFREWRSRYRIAWAVQAIATGEHSIAEVIYRAGYKDRRTFERTVKRLTGVTPGCLQRYARAERHVSPGRADP